MKNIQEHSSGSVGLFRAAARLLAVAALAVACGYSPSTAQAAAKAPAKGPNIIYILADDLGKCELGCYGQKKIKTPRLDRLAEEGIRFTNHYTGAPVCAPARCTLITGQHLGHAYIRDNKEIQPEGQFPIPGDSVTIAKLLKQRGYATGAFGKWGLGPVGSCGDPNNAGFDEFFGYNCQRQAHSYYPDHLWRNREKVLLDNAPDRRSGKQYAHDMTANAALDFIRNHKDKPFFLFVPFIIPHVPLQVPEDSLKEYTDLGWNDPPYDGRKGYFPHPTPRAAYAAMITRMDRQIGQILDLVKELGLDDNTIVFFASDNGATHDVGGVDTNFFRSEGDMRGRKGSCYEGGISAPLIARWPGRIQPGTTTDVLSAFYDMMPTFADLAGQPIEPGVSDGVSLLPSLLGDSEKQTQHKFLYWEFYGYNGQKCVRMGDWKAIQPDLNRKLDPAWELYNLKDDPTESKNVADQFPKLIEQAKEIARQEHRDSPLWSFRGTKREK